ncbi:MAG: hypothetical protein IE931_05500 [Sphingobacteriales bacterium]|nr:hypothetical protein [Sphingobacteriales bacterium]
MSDIKKALKQLTEKTGFTQNIELAIVKAVDELEMTCDVQLYDNEDAILEGVKLKPVVSGVSPTDVGPVIFPAKYSFVLVAQVANDPADLFVVGFTKIQKVKLDAGSLFKMLMDMEGGSMAFDLGSMVLNGGKNGGLPKIKPLVAKINQLEKKVNDLLDAFKKHTHTGVTTGGGVTGFTTNSGPAIIDLLTKVDDLENTAIKQ